MATFDLDRIAAGDPAAAAALMRGLDDDRPAAREALRAIYPRGGQAFVAGFTGSPGVGKSTLVAALVGAVRARGERVAVVAVDPSSPFSGGALLGDRVRMQRHATDPGVFIRSLASRGQAGGLSRSTASTVAVLDAARFPLIFVETVGAGQAEVAVADAADAVVVVTAPGLGDEVQALKSGLLEIADLVVVNKSDREGADRAAAQLATMLALGARPPPTVLQASAADGKGVNEVLAALDGWRARPAAERAARRRARAVKQLTAMVGELARARVGDALAGVGAADPLQALVDAVAERTIDPWTAADQLFEVLK